MKTETQEELEAKLLDLRLQIRKAKEEGNRQGLIEQLIERDKVERELNWLTFEKAFLEV